jgi:MFS family permease
VLALFQNLFGLAAGPFLTGVLSDLYGLKAALAAAPVLGLLAAAFFVLAARSYEADVRRVEKVDLEVEGSGGARPALA